MHGTRDPRPAEHAPSTALPLGPVLAALGANMALAFGPLFVRLADVGPVAAGFWRLALAAPLLVIAGFFARGGYRGSAPLLGVLAIGGIAFAADLGSWHLGIRQTTLANATLFGNSATLIFPIYGFLIARAWPTRSQAFALLIAAAGGGLLMGRSYSASPEHLVGDLLCVFAGVLYAIYFIAMARAREGLGSVQVLALSTVAGLLPLLGAAALLGETIWPNNWGPLILLALLSQLIGQGLMIYALGVLPPLVIGIALLVQPVVAAIIGWVQFDERLGWPDLLGAALVAAALVLIRRKPVAAPPPVPQDVPERIA